MTPVYIDGCYAVLHPANGERAVVICGPLGDENLNAYRAQVFLAERLAQAGFPALRISYYGTGDSRGDDDEPCRFRAWINSIHAAEHWLRSACGATSVALCGLRIGAALAAQAASELDDVNALILLAPVASGRRFLREQLLTARTVADIWQSRNPIDDERWFEAYGLRMDRATRDALDGLDIGKLPHLPVRRVLLLDQPGAPSNLRLVQVLRGRGIDVTHETGTQCDGLLRESHEARVPHEAFARIVGWLGDAATVSRQVVNVMPGPLEMPEVHEQPVRLGLEGSLAGILALPSQCDSTSPVVLIPSMGGNPRPGTSRGAVELARWLAHHGLASLRMDGHGIGDSAPATGECGTPYGKQGDLDVCAGVDFLRARFDGPIIVFGMCSGAYHAFQAALIDHRISGLILVNLQKFVWHDGESLSVVQRTTFRTTGFYLRNLANPAMWRRLMRGQVNAGGIARALASRAARQLAAAADPAIAAVSGETQVGMVRRQLAELSGRSVRILYLLSGNDPGLDEIAEYFGLRGWRLRRNPGVMFQTMDGADHTLSAYWARQRLRQAIALYLRERFNVDMAADAAAVDGSRRNPGGRSLLPAAIRRRRQVLIDSAPTTA